MPLLGEIRLFPYSHPPQGWIRCDGSLLPIQNFQALFDLLGTTYGGNGSTTFGIPDLRARSPVGHGAPPFIEGKRGGSETHVLTQEQMPAHRHVLQARNANATEKPPTDNWMAVASTPLFRREVEDKQNPPVKMHPQSITEMGGDQPHNNMQPYLVLNFCIAITGTYPPRSVSSAAGEPQ